jgi:alkyldihydroxyacetonephosphate synthase
VSYRQSKVFQQGAFNDTLEVAAPWARLQAVYGRVRKAAGAHALVLAHLSHAYPDGCSVYFTLVGTRKGDALGRYDALIDAALGAAVSEGATLSHHHGVGSSKAHLLDAELGGGLDTVRRLRRAWDPEGVFNPTTFEPQRPAPELRLSEPVPGIDAHSGIASFRGDTPLAEIEAAAQRHGLSLGLSGPLPPLSLAGFIDAGLPGMPDPFSDPVRRRRVAPPGPTCWRCASALAAGWRAWSRRRSRSCQRRLRSLARLPRLPRSARASTQPGSACWPHSRALSRVLMKVSPPSAARRRNKRLW